MTPYDYVAYLFFLKRSKGNIDKFSNELFHFHRYCCLTEQVEWRKLFVFEDYQVSDYDFTMIISTLVFHNFITEQYTLTPIGEEYLEKNQQNDAFSSLFDSFLSTYKGEAATTKSCFVDQELFAVSCHFCTQKLCLNTKTSLIDFLPFALKKRKNPYRSVTL